MSSSLINIYMSTEDNVFRRNWRPAAAIVYLLICVFDFVIMPALLTRIETKRDFTAIYEQIAKLDNPQAQVALINKIDLSVQEWKPLTLGGGGMFHLSMGALLTGAAVTRGMERTAIAKRRRRKVIDDSDNF